MVMHSRISFLHVQYYGSSIIIYMCVRLLGFMLCRFWKSTHKVCMILVSVMSSKTVLHTTFLCNGVCQNLFFSRGMCFTWDSHFLQVPFYFSQVCCFCDSNNRVWLHNGLWSWALLTYSFFSLLGLWVSCLQFSHWVCRTHTKWKSSWWGYSFAGQKWFK